jgi:hypothetical protein
MPAASVTLFNQFKLDLGTKKHDLSADTFKLAFVPSSAALTAATSDPRWGAGGGTNLAALEVATGTAYSAGGLTLTGVGWTLVAGVPTWAATEGTVAQDATSGFTNARYAVLYNSTDSGKRAVGFIDMLSDRRIDTGPLSISTTGNVAFTLT